MNRLFIHLSKTPNGVCYSEQPSRISVGGQEFRDAGLGHWTGFYDWLRVAPGKIVGVRYWPFEGEKFLLTTLKPGPSLSIDPVGGLLVFFGDEKKYEEKLSDDQAFEEISLFKSANGDYGILLGCSGLSENERRSLRERFGNSPSNNP